MTLRYHHSFLICLLLCASDSFAMCVAPYMRLVVLQPVSCKQLSDHRGQVISEWKKESDGLPPEVLAKRMERIEEMLDHNRGIILHVQVLRERELWLDEVDEKYVYRAGDWKELNEPRDYYYQTSNRKACKLFEPEEAKTMYADSSCCDTVPPDAIDCLLAMKVLWKPPRWSREFFEAPGK